MSAPIPTGNGCSLEDCYTNLFALTDICGIKWRKLSIEPQFTQIDPLEDPVLSSYAKCLQSDILCVWRRTAKRSEQRPTDVTFGKELWIFWYGDQPSLLDELLSPTLKAIESGSWDKDSVLSYECRTLLFKALHNLIERCLLSKNFIRLGKWFVQPQAACSDQISHLSFCFNFFLHGESTVCASIEVKQHPPVAFLSAAQLNIAQENQTQLQVILAPYGLNGTLTGQAYRDSDHATRKHLEEWKQFYPVRLEEGKETDTNKLPNLVEVVVAGARMKYPSCFVLLVEDEHNNRSQNMADPMHMSSSGHAHGHMPRPNPLPPQHSNMVHNGPLTPPTSPEDVGILGDISGLKLNGHGNYSQRPAQPTSDVTARVSRVFCSQLVEKVRQDCCITAGISKRPTENVAEGLAAGMWDYAEPSSKGNCNCLRLRNQKAKVTVGGNQGKGGGGGNKHPKGDKGLERQQSRINRTTPFHRRNQGGGAAVEEMTQFEMAAFMPPRGGAGNTGAGAGNASFPAPGPTSANISGGGNSGGGGATSGGSGVGGGNVGGNIVGNPPVSSSNSASSNTTGSNSSSCNNNISATEVVNNLESPASNAPSPLEEPHTQPVDSAQNMDPTMPTLSPHPPLKGGEKDGQGKQTSGETQHSNANPVMNGTDPVFHKPQINPKTENAVSLFPWNHHGQEAKHANVNSWLRSQQKQVEHRGLKRPNLPTAEDDVDELITDSLYNFDAVHTWSDYPLKKVRHNTQLEQLIGVEDIKQATYISGQNHRPSKPPTPQPPAPDPYEFTDEPSINPTVISRNSLRNSRDGRDDLFHRPSPFNKDDEKMDGSKHNGDAYNDRNMDMGSIGSPPTTPGAQVMGGSLTREVDLIPQKSDLDNLFESDSDSNDDAFIHQSPMGNRNMEDNRNTKLTNIPAGQVDIIAPSELARMYPTPPSMETNPVLSPLTSLDMSIESGIVESISISIKTESIAGTLTEELSKDSMCVYKPPKQAKFVNSYKFATVELYSTQLSPIPNVPFYKPSWQYPVMEKAHHSHHSHHHHHHHHSHQSQYTNLPSIENIPSLSSRMPSNAIEASPATFQHSVGQQRTPMSYELQSPASNASSYLNKTLNSIDNHGTNNQIPDVHSLLVNIVLSDSILNLFKDHNFDSCNICVCNMNIKGADVGVYIPDPSGEIQYKCMCGFSAVMNKRHGHNAGLFYEDEVDITGVRDDRFEARKSSLIAIELAKQEGGGGVESVKSNIPEDVTQSVLQLLLEQFSCPFPNCSTDNLNRGLTTRSTTCPNTSVNMIMLQDGNEAAYNALEQGRQAMEHCHPTKLEDNIMKSTCLHKWTYLQGVTQMPQNSMDTVRLLKSLQPLLQDAIQNKRMTRLWEHAYKLSGPLTYIEFHQMAGRGGDENSEPQPIPAFLVGYDKDALTVSPYALKFWDKQFMEPYGRSRDIAYVVVTPENDLIMNQVKMFFKELSTVYELSRLGKHCPISEKIRDGILRVGKGTAQKLAEQEVDDWFKQIGDSPIAAKLRLYAQACRHHLAPFLATQTLDKSIFQSTSPSQSRPSQRPPETNIPSSDSNNPNSEENKDSSQGEGNGGHRESHDEQEDSHEVPALVIYLINPFTYGQDWEELDRLAMVGLLRCYQEIIPPLPEHMQNNVYLQIVPLKAIIDSHETGTHFQLLKNMAFSVFTSCRWNLSHSIMGRSLTGFGPASAADIILKQGGVDKLPHRLYNPAFVLAPVKDKQSQLAESCGDQSENSTILFCAYCLSEDQRWLLACCTDDRGELMQTCTVNVEIPNRNRRKKTSARKIGLSKLWDFLQGVVSMTVHPCRLVIGRFGRIGHGELKGWSGLLSKKNIQRCNKRLRDSCSQCSNQNMGEYPCILSACLTSLEQQPSFDVMTECVKFDEKLTSNCPLQTPRDASSTHILVFPTSATAQANTHTLPLDSPGGMNLGPNHFELGVDLSDINIKDDFESNNDDFGSLMDVFVSMTENSPPLSPRHGCNVSNPGSPTADLGRNSPSKMNGLSIANPSSAIGDPQDEAPNLLQQPLAMGYYISTAKTGPLPRWFWSACPENELATVKCFKSALHVRCSSNLDEFMQQTQARNTHPLDSSLTCDVLRFVLEKYNSLSWLTFDPAKNDRQSCLPIHMMVLMQIYHAMNAYV